MAENNDLKMEVESLRTEVALLTPESERNTCSIKMEESATVDRRSSRYDWISHTLANILYILVFAEGGYIRSRMGNTTARHRILNMSNDIGSPIFL